MINSVSKEYSKALFELNLSYNDVIRKMSLLIDVFTNRENRKYFFSPNVDRQEKKEIIKKILNSNEDNFLYFIYVLLDNNRLEIIEDIYTDYCDMVDEMNNVGRFTLHTSNSISDEYLEQIKNILKRKFNKQIVLNVIIDEKIIGGIIIKYKNMIIDDSIIGKLNDLKKKLLK